MEAINIAVWISGSLPTLIGLFLVVVLPWRFFIRAVAWEVAAVMLLFLFWPRVHWDHDWGYDWFVAVLVLVMTVWVIAIGTRVIAQAMWHKGLPPIMPLRGDALIGIAFGIIGAVAFFLTSAQAFAGNSYVATVHVGHFVFAIAVFYYGRRNFLIWGFSFGIVAFTAFSLWFPTLVTQRAAQAAEGGLHCIYLMQRGEALAERRDLTFLTMDKGDRSPHAAVVIMSDPPTYGSWSYRQRVFITPWQVYHPTPTMLCPTD